MPQGHLHPRPPLPGHPDAARPLPTEAQKLMESCQGIVKSLAWKIHQKVPKHVELDDLISYGQLGLAQAARDYDPTRGGQFTTYAYYRIRGAILDGLSQMSWFSRHDYHACRYERQANEVLQVEAPPPEAGASHSDEPGWLGRVSGALTMAYLVTGMEPKPSGTDESSEPASHAIAEEVVQKLRDLIDALPDEPRQLIKSMYFEGQTLTDAGKKLGISKAWASRLHSKTLLRLAHALRLSGTFE